MKLTKKQKELGDLAQPLINWLNENTDIHHEIIIKYDSVELKKSILYSFNIDFWENKEK